MGSFAHQSFSSSPVVVLPPQLPPQPSYSMQSSRPVFKSPFANSIQQSPSTSSWNLTPTPHTPALAAGRKRSRDDAASNLEDDYFPVQAPVQPEENEDEWEYGEGMILIKKNSNYITDASSQTGTWAEEKADEEKAKTALISTPSTERPIFRATKSQRLNLNTTPAIAEEVSNNGVLVSPPSPERHVEPTVDDFTRHLGIGWSSVNNEDADIQAAARGWAKFIENHFPVTNAQIRLQSKGLSSYLVEATEGYFLFADDLRQGRLVSTSLEKTWVNLKGPTPTFEGEVTMEAGETPKVDVAQPITSTEHVMNGVGVRFMDDRHTMANQLYGVNGNTTGLSSAQQLPGQTMEVEMDMS